MLDELLKLVSGESQEQIVNNPMIPNDQNETAIHTTTNAIFEGMKGEVNQGNGADVLSLLGGKSGLQGNPMVGNLTGSVSSSLMDKLGISSPAAKQIAGTLVPVILAKLVKRTNDPNDSSFDLNGIFGSLTGGKSNQFDMGSLLGQVSGNAPQQNNDKEAVDIGSIFNLISGK